MIAYADNAAVMEGHVIERWMAPAIARAPKCWRPAPKPPTC